APITLPLLGLMGSLPTWLAGSIYWLILIAGVFSVLWVTTRARERLKEEMDLLGPKPRSEVDEAQQLIVATVRRLEEEGKIQMARGGTDEELIT
ncbi:MAG: FliG C-terminal domain-containing protein, partial [Planctomycetota bacterium]